MSTLQEIREFLDANGELEGYGDSYKPSESSSEDLSDSSSDTCYRG